MLTTENDSSEKPSPQWSSLTEDKILPTWVPRTYQVEGIRLCITQACAGMLLRPGMGKTTILYAVHDILRKQGLVKRTLVISPIKPMYNVWPKQCATWANFAHIKVGVAHGKARVETLMDATNEIVVINPEGLEWLTDDKHPELLQYLKENFTMLIVDESTKFKNTNTQRFKRMRKFVKFFKRRYILTGSFTPKGLLDLFGQIYLLDEGSSLGSYITHYKNKYFYATDHLGYNLVPHDWAPTVVAEKIAPLTLVMERAGNIQLPELLPPNDIYVDLPAKARERYNTMEEHMLLMLDNQEMLVASNAAVASGKCRQVANGFIYTGGEDHEWEDLHDAKIEALQELVDELSGEPLLVAYEFGADLEKLKKAFPTAIWLTSGNAKKDDAAITGFCGGMYTVALAQVKSISLGIDGLQNSCSNVCMFGITWDLEAYSQCIDRVWRSGNRSKFVSVHRILARDTVDERVASVLLSKEATQTTFLNLLKKMRSS